MQTLKNTMIVLITFCGIPTSPEAETLPAYCAVVELATRVLGVVAVMVGLRFVSLPADVAEVRALLLPLVHHLDVCAN